MIPSVAVEEQQEKLRRVVDSWRCRSHDLLRNLHDDPYQPTSAVDSSSSNYDPIRVSAEPLEHSDISTLFESENVAVAKFVTVLSYDCIEISKLSKYASKNLYRRLLLFGHRSSSQAILLEGETQKTFGQSLSLFMELSEIKSRITAVLGNLVEQLESICSLQDKNGRPYKSFKNVMLKTAFTSLGDGLAVFLVLDQIFIQNSHIKSYISFYARMLNKVKMEVDNFGISAEDLTCLHQVVSHLEKVLDVGFFRRLLEEESSWQDILQKLRCNRKFLDACTSCTHDSLSEIISRLDTWKEFPFDRRKVLGQLALFLFGVYASAEAAEKKLGKLIAEMLQVVPVVYVEDGIRFILLDLLKIQRPQLLSSWSTLREAAKDSVSMSNNYLRRLTEMHSRDWQAMKGALACWVASFQSTIQPMTELSRVQECLRLHWRQIIQGILLASRMQIMTISMLDLHALLEVPIKREKLKSLCHMVVLLKVVENTFHKKGLDIIHSLPHMVNLLQADIEQLLLPAKDILQAEVAKGSQASKLRFLSSLTRGGKDMDTRLADSLSLVLLSLQMLQGGGSNKRQIILSNCLDVVQCIGHLDISCVKIEKLMSKIDVIANFQYIVEEVTNCSFLYWRKELIGTWLAMVYTDVNKFSWIQPLFDAFCDGLWFLKFGHVGKSTLQLQEEELENSIKNEIITPLCRDIETDLRLHVHSTSLKGSVQLNLRKTGVRNLSWYLQMKPLHLPFKCIDIKFHVESYLNSSFYNHTAMSSYNWKVYSEMRQLAELKYGLILDDIHLPEHSLDHGLDVTEIMKDLQKFTTTYSYNLNNQVFIEKVSYGHVRKALKIFSIEHVASSVASHGLGTISNAVSSVIRFLAEKIAFLAELLQDKFPRSHLVKEFKLWQTDKGASKKDLLAEALNITVGKVPFADHELVFIEQLRTVITEIGNALGLVRILKAGGYRHSYNISRFICRPSNVSSFAEKSQKLGFTDETVRAGRIMDIVVENKYQSADHTNYLLFLRTIYSKELENPEYLHFKDFFLLIPALIVNLIDCKVHFKDKVPRRSSDVGSPIALDDGFVVGVAYILQITGQEKSFDGLHWFSSASKQLEEALLFLEENRGKEQQKASGLSRLKLWGQAPPISTEAQKGVDKVKRYQKEMQLIQCTLNLARAVLSY